MGPGGIEDAADAGRDGLPPVVDLHLKEYGRRAAERVTIVHSRGGARGLRKRLIVAECIEVAHGKLDEIELTVVPFLSNRLVKVLELLFGTKGHFVSVVINVRDANAGNGDVVQGFDLGGEYVPGGLLRKSNAADKTIGRSGELELDGRHG